MTTYLYRLSSETELLYVGITKNPTIRFTNHATNKSWWPEVIDINLSMYPSLDAAIAAEGTAIAEEHPRHNLRNDSAHPHSLRDVVEPESKLVKRPLPAEEAEYLLNLENDEEVITRSYELFRAGWSMKEIIKYTRLHPSSSYLRTKFAETVPEATGRPLPEVPELPDTLSVASRKARGLGLRTSARSLTPTETTELRALAKAAKAYRASYSPAHPSAIAVDAYIILIRHLHDDEKITLADIARAAEVALSTIHRRYKA